MSQHDFIINNQVGSSFRVDMNNAAAAMATNNNGASAPADPYAYQIWCDTSSNVIRQRNGANTAWGIIGYLNSGLYRPHVYATDRLIGRTSANSGAHEELSCTTVGRSILSAPNASGGRNALGISSPVHVLYESTSAVALDTSTSEIEVFTTYVLPNQLGVNKMLYINLMLDALSHDSEPQCTLRCYYGGQVFATLLMALPSYEPVAYAYQTRGLMMAKSATSQCGYAFVDHFMVNFGSYYSNYDAADYFGFYDYGEPGGSVVSGATNLNITSTNTQILKVTTQLSDTWSVTFMCRHASAEIVGGEFT